MGVVVVLEHVGHSVGGGHVTVGGQVHSSHSAQQLSQAGGSGHVVGSHVAVKIMIKYLIILHGTKSLTHSFNSTFHTVD